MNAPAYNFAYLDEQTKRMIRRALLKAVAIPGYQVPFASREMPMPYGWGTGGVQVTAAILGPQDVLKVIDQGSDDTTNAISIRKFFGKTAGVATTTSTADATVIQTRHRIPEAPLHAGQVLVYQVPIPEPLRFLEPRETETRRMHALGEYGLMHVKLYEDIAVIELGLRVKRQHAGQIGARRLADGHNVVHAAGSAVPSACVPWPCARRVSQ